jgi:PASTA domain
MGQSGHESVSREESSNKPSIIQRWLPEGVAFRIQADEAIPPVPGQSTQGFNAHAGEVMADPSVFAIYWGRDFGAPDTGTNARASNMDSFLTMVMSSTYLDLLGEYSVGRGEFIGSTWIDHQPSIPLTVTYDQMRDLLIGWLDTGISPAVPALDEHNLLFVIFASSQVTFTDNDGKGGFCGYHYYGHYHNSPLGKDNLFFAVIDSTGDTATVGHELVEAFTDRSSNGWYSDDDPYSEIADSCSFCGSPGVTLNGFPLASYWLTSKGRCLQQSDITAMPPSIVPNVLGESAGPARTAIEAAGFLLHQQSVADHTCAAIGKVIRQSPQAGSQESEGSVVSIWIGARPPHECPPGNLL